MNPKGGTAWANVERWEDDGLGKKEKETNAKLNTFTNTISFNPSKTL